MRRGISPVIATVILVAIALVISIAVVGWVMGIWGSLGATEALQILPDSYINVSEKSLYLNISNKGTASATIYKVEIYATNGTETDTSLWNIPVGNVTSITITDLRMLYRPGTYYTIKIYTTAGNVYTGTVRAEP